MKHKFSRVFSGILACCMAVLIMPLQAEAAGGPTYDVYQIFTGELAAGDEGSDLAGKTVMTAIKWGRNGTGTEGEEPDEAVLTELAQLNGYTTEAGVVVPASDDRAKLNVIAKYVDLESGAFLSGLALSELSTVTVPVGYYYICNTPGSVGPNDGYTAGVTVVSSEFGTLDVIPKAGSVSVRKYVANRSGAVRNRLEYMVGSRPDFSLDGVSVEDMALTGTGGFGIMAGRKTVVAEEGDIVDFQIYVPYPDNIEYYSDFYIAFADDIPAGLELIDSSVLCYWDMMDQQTNGWFSRRVMFGSRTNGETFDGDGIVGMGFEKSGQTLYVHTSASEFDHSVTTWLDNDKNVGSGGAVNVGLQTCGISLCYACKVTNGAFVSEANVNQAKVQWLNDPTDTGWVSDGIAPEHLAETVVTDDAKASVWTPGLTMHLESKSGNPIANAKFELARTDSYENADGESVTRTITECSIRTPVFSEYQAGQYVPMSQVGRYMWAYNLISEDGFPDGVTCYDVRDNSPVASTGSGTLNLTTDGNGMMVVTGLPCGTYRLHLVEDVKGYNKLDDIEFQIVPVTSDIGSLDGNMFGGEVEGFQLLLADGTMPMGMSPNTPYTSGNWGYVNMQLTSGIVLPTTGGPGVTAYLVIGAAIVLLAGACLARKRRAA